MLIVVLSTALGCSDDSELTWTEWVAEERPRREAAGEHYYYIDGFPKISAWTPTDFLSPSDLEASHVELCDLPPEEARKVMRVIQEFRDGDRDASDIVLPELIRYAERGIVEAQFMLLQCSERLPQTSSLSVDESWKWQRRAAASGNPYAMSSLATCIEMAHIMPDGDFQDAVKSFAADELLYWSSRAAESLEDRALFRLMKYLGPFYTYDDDFERSVEREKWNNLYDLSLALSNALPTLQELAGELRGTAVAAGAVAATVPDEVETEAARRTLEWLAEHPNAIRDFRTPFGCPDDRWWNDGALPINFEAADRAIERLRKLAEGTATAQ